MTTQPDPFDQMLAAALRTRPEHATKTDIAAEAISRAHLHAQQARHLARISFWTRLCSAAAVLLVVATIAVAWWEWPASTTTTSATSEVASSTDTTTTSSSLDMTTVGGGAFLVALLAVAGLMVLAPERPAWRLTPA